MPLRRLPDPCHPFSVSLSAPSRTNPFRWGAHKFQIHETCMHESIYLIYFYLIYFCAFAPADHDMFPVSLHTVQRFFGRPFFSFPFFILHRICLLAACLSCRAPLLAGLRECAQPRQRGGTQRLEPAVRAQSSIASILHPLSKVCPFLFPIC
jgi:hypothetical protein